MQFHEFAESLFGSKVKIKLIRHLLREEAVRGEREVAKLIRVSHSAVNKALKDFSDLNLVKPMRVGDVKIWHLNKESYAYNFVMSFPHWIKKSTIEDLKSTVSSYLGHLSSVKKVVIFGSVAEGRELPNSDIDLFILVEKEKNRKEVLNSVSSLSERCLRYYGNKLSPQIFTYKDLKKTRNKKFFKNVEKGIKVKW